MLTQERKKEIYIEARKFLDGILHMAPDMNMRSGFCRPITAFQTPSEDLAMDKPMFRDIKNVVRNTLRNFPELLAHEPQKWYNDYFWFEPAGEGVRKRIAILDEIISKM